MRVLQKYNIPLTVKTSVLVDIFCQLKQRTQHPNVRFKVASPYTWSEPERRTFSSVKVWLWTRGIIDVTTGLFSSCVIATGWDVMRPYLFLPYQVIPGGCTQFHGSLAMTTGNSATSTVSPFTTVWTRGTISSVKFRVLSSWPEKTHMQIFLSDDTANAIWGKNFT